MEAGRPGGNGEDRNPGRMRAATGYPASVAYPTAEVVSYFDKFGKVDLWTSTISYMLAMAIYHLAGRPQSLADGEQQSVIGVYGVDMLQDSEYASQRPTLEYLIGLARGRGLIVEIPERSALCKANFVYGLVSGPAQAVGITEAFLKERLDKYTADKGKATQRWNETLAIMHDDRRAYQRGGLRSIDYAVRHFNRGGVLEAKKATTT